VQPTGAKAPQGVAEPKASGGNDGYDKLTTSKPAKALGIRTGQLDDKYLAAGFIECDGDYFKLTFKGKAAGGKQSWCAPELARLNSLKFTPHQCRVLTST
jgi:hypothetical protein